jgi:hypothetical protein
MSENLKNPSVYSGSVYKELGEYLVTVLVSGLLGALVALPFVFLFEQNMLSGMLKGCLAGAVIGLLSRTAFGMVLRTVHVYPFWAFVSVFLTIGGGTVLSSYLFGLRQILFLVLITGLAEAVGLSLTLLVYRYSLYLNNRLHTTQEKIQAKEKAT